MKIRYLLPMILLTSCLCNTPPELKPFLVDRDFDGTMGCANVDYEIHRTVIELTSLERKYEELVAYSRNPLCLPATESQFLRAREASKTRLEKLLFLQEFKHCLPQHEPEPELDTLKASTLTNVPNAPTTPAATTNTVAAKVEAKVDAKVDAKVAAKKKTAKKKKVLTETILTNQVIILP
jgi:hypothetical protein